MADTDLRINEADIYRWFSVFRPTGELTEIRVIDRRKKAWSGYFKTPESVINALKENPEMLKGNVFQIFNAVKTGCYERIQKDKFLLGATGTSDDDISGRSWIFIDIDPVRPADTNANDDDEKYAIATTRKVVHFLLSEGFREPVVVASANGAHIYLKCELENTPENKKLTENFIKVMRSLFDDDRVKIDPAIFNASRFAKLPGTKSGKGDPNSESHPQRWCRFLKIPDQIIPSEKSLFVKVANMLPETPKPARDNNWGRDKFDLQEFIRKHGIEVRQEVHTDLGTRYILAHCLFNPEHKGKDAMIFQYKDGSIAYKCFHASCSQYTWRDVRLMFEPDAYDRKDYADYSYKRRLRGEEKPQFIPQKEDNEKGHIWLSLREIPTVDPDSLVKIATGIKSLDDKICGGTILNQLSVMTGRPASGKSTILNTILLSSVNQGFPTAIFSGELPNHLLKSWITLPAAGRSRVVASRKYGDSYYVPKDVEEKILDWLDGKLFIHNSEYGNNWGQLKEDIRDVIGKGAKNIILDNLMTIDLDYERDYEKTKAQIGFIQNLHDMVRVTDIHIWLVAHPRKQVNFLRYDDISGASEIANLADNIVVVHRVNQDFENQAKTFFPKGKLDNIKDMGYTNVVEIAKNRIPGIHIGELCGVYYEPESKRMKNSIDETFSYGWDVAPVQSVIPQTIESNQEFDSPDEMWYNKKQDDGLEF